MKFIKFSSSLFIMVYLAFYSFLNITVVQSKIKSNDLLELVTIKNSRFIIPEQWQRQFPSSLKDDILYANKLLESAERSGAELTGYKNEENVFYFHVIKPGIKKNFPFKSQDESLKVHFYIFPNKYSLVLTQSILYELHNMIHSFQYEIGLETLQEKIIGETIPELKNMTISKKVYDVLSNHFCLIFDVSQICKEIIKVKSITKYRTKLLTFDYGGQYKGMQFSLMTIFN